jgi:hypothetical protein
MYEIRNSEQESGNKEDSRDKDQGVRLVLLLSDFLFLEYSLILVP